MLGPIFSECVLPGMLYSNGYCFKCSNACLEPIWMPSNGLGVFWSEITELQPKGNRLVISVHVCIFRWYFTVAQSFGGILRFSCSFSATEPIFPFFFIPELTSTPKLGEGDEDMKI